MTAVFLAEIEQIVTKVNKKLVVYKNLSTVTVLDKPMAMTSMKKIQRTKVSRTIARIRGLW